MNKNDLLRRYAEDIRDVDNISDAVMHLENLLDEPSLQEDKAPQEGQCDKPCKACLELGHAVCAQPSEGVTVSDEEIRKQILDVNSIDTGDRGTGIECPFCHSDKGNWNADMDGIEHKENCAYLLSKQNPVKENKCICEIGRPYNNLCCPIHGGGIDNNENPVKDEREKSIMLLKSVYRARNLIVPNPETVTAEHQGEAEALYNLIKEIEEYLTNTNN